MFISQEKIPNAEQALIEALAADVIAKQEKEHKPGTVARRDVHSKSNGLFKATFRVLDGLPEALRVGLFATPATYDAVIRFSNGALGTAADAFPNIRGCAIKLHGVPGDKALPCDQGCDQHDILLANSRTFFTQTMEQMGMLIRGQMKELFKAHPNVIRMMAAAMLKVVKNPLQTSYFSQVPYGLGDGAAKFVLMPERGSCFFSVPNIFDKDFLRHRAERLLRRKEQVFSFYVQLQRDATSDPIEDSSVAWGGPFVKVATVTVLKVTSTTTESDGEELSFHPWRALTAHRPLGWPGRLRRAIYSADFAWRTAQNAANASSKVIQQR